MYWTCPNCNDQDCRSSSVFCPKHGACGACGTCSKGIHLNFWSESDELSELSSVSFGCPLCRLFSCLLLSPRVLNGLRQNWHWYGISLVWIRSCSFLPAFVDNSLGQKLHLYFGLMWLGPCCVASWRFFVLRHLNFWSQCVHFVRSIFRVDSHVTS